MAELEAFAAVNRNNWSTFADTASRYLNIHSEIVKLAAQLNTLSVGASAGVCPVVVSTAAALKVELEALGGVGM